MPSSEYPSAALLSALPPGCFVAGVGPTEFVGRLPVRMDIEVLAPGESSKQVPSYRDSADLVWKIMDHLGKEVSREIVEEAERQILESLDYVCDPRCTLVPEIRFNREPLV